APPVPCILLHRRRLTRRTAGCPSGQRERSVKPPAQPTLVRTQHLPPAGPRRPTPHVRAPARPVGRGLAMSGHVRPAPTAYGHWRNIRGTVAARSWPATPVAAFDLEGRG